MDITSTVTPQRFAAQAPFQPTLIIKNLAQMQELAALERMLATIYGSSKPVSLAEILEKIQCDSLTISLLKHLAFAPICTGLLDGLKQSLTMTDEGKRLFEISQILFGFHGQVSVSSRFSANNGVGSNTTIAVKLKLSPAEVKQSTIRLKARLQAPNVRNLVEQIVRQQLAIFKSSGLCQAMLLQQNSFVASGPVTGEWTVSSKVSAESEIPRQVEKVLTALAETNRINIVGGTGTGKTAIASEVALALAQAGKKVLLVTHSRLLAAQLRYQHQQYLAELEEKEQHHFSPTHRTSAQECSTLTISTFHALCHSAAQTANLNPPKSISTRVFNEIFPELLIEATNLYSDLKFDAIVVDEGHSFGASLWRALMHCLRDQANGEFVFCYDPQLLAFNRLSIVPHAATTIELKTCLKPNIDLLASNESSELYEVSSAEEQAETVQFVVDNLLEGGKYHPNDIAILSANNEKSHRFKFANGVKVCQQPVKAKSRAILETSLFQFRALTAKVVILIDLFDAVEKLSDWKFQYFCYLVWGRATDKLIIVGREEAMARLLPREVTTLATAEILPTKGRKQ
ncbi:MAG: DEAD/DEAH box helicase family protein [Candidatus Obscuribacterales bacterium]|jgi:hypothetical protein